MTTHIDSSCIDLDSKTALDPKVVGSKAANLARLRSLGYQVPPGLIVLPAAEPSTAVKEAIARLGDVHLAVRSSSIVEDLPGASFAGQYETVLGVSGVTAIKEAIEIIRSSSVAPAERGYANESSTEMPVLLMPMLFPECAGVSFTANPVTGDPHVVIEAVAGLGESLVSGETTPQRWVSGERVDESDDADLLTPAHISDLETLGRRIESDMGFPQDIEWALCDDELLVLQTRPITALPIEPEDELPRETEIWQRDAGFSGPTRMAEISAWTPIFEKTTRAVFAEIGAPLDYMVHRRIGGWTYLRAVPPMDRGKDDMKPPPAIVFGLLMRLIPALRKQLARAADMWEEGLGDSVATDWLESEKDALRSRARRLRSVDLQAMSDTELDRHLTAVIDQLQAASDAHFRIPVLATFLPMGRLGVLCERVLGWKPEKIAQLVKGYAGDTSRADAMEALADSTDEGVPDPGALAAFLDEHGHQTIGVDLAQPTWAEEPAPLLALLGARSGQPLRSSDDTSIAEAAESEARREFEGPDLEEFETALDLARRGASLGDQTETDVLQALALLRYVLYEIGRRLSQPGLIAAPEDVLHLTIEESRDLLAGERHQVDVGRRKAEYAWALAHPGPDRIGPEPPSWPNMQYAPRRARPFLESMVWVMTHLDGKPVPDHESEQSSPTGLPASPGVVTGTVRVINDPSEFTRIRPGDVLVCPATIAAWSVVFPQISAIVTERGGPLSHPGILAREYGIPAVLSIAGATTLFQDGELVTVNGTEGTVTRAH